MLTSNFSYTLNFCNSENPLLNDWSGGDWDEIIGLDGRRTFPRSKR